MNKWLTNTDGSLRDFVWCMGPTMPTFSLMFDHKNQLQFVQWVILVYAAVFADGPVFVNRPDISQISKLFYEIQTDNLR